MPLTVSLDGEWNFRYAENLTHGKAGGTITNVDEKGKLRLAYEIQKMKEGFYYFIQFDANAEAPAQIEASVRIMESVLRYLCVRQDAE